jgi:putative RecB family exonuclease
MKMSYSKLSTFEQCPLKFKFQYVNRFPTASSPALLLGQTIHSALDKYFSFSEDRRSLSILKNLFRSEWKMERNKLREQGNLDMDKETEIEHGKRGLIMLENFYSSSLNYEPVEREEFVEAELKDGMPFLGRIDRLDKVRIDGREGFKVVDYKTGKLSERFIDFIQLFTYAWLMNEQGHRVIFSAFYYLEQNKLIEKPLNDTIYEQTRNKLIEKCLPVYEALETDTFEPKESALCPYCDYVRMCPLKQA